MAAGTMRASVFKHRESIARSSVSSARPSVYGLALPLGLNLGDDFNLAKARADAAAAGSQASSYRSRRQSGSSQVSYSSRRSARSGRTGRRGRGRKAVKAGAENLEPEIIQVFDENGKDVTPKPLVSLRPTVLHEKLLQAPPDHFSPESERVSSLSRVGYCSSMGSITPETFDVEDGLQKDEKDVNLAKRGSIVATQGGATSAPADRTPEQKRVTVVTAGVPPPQSEEGLEKMVTVTLKETDTFVLLDLWGNSVSNAYSDLKQVLERNLHYKKLLQDKIGSDNYSDSAAQTLMSLQKSKESQLSAVPSQSEACQVNSWDISDSYTGKDQAESVNVPKLPGTITTATAGTVTEPDNSNIATMLVSAGYLEKPGSSNAAPYYSQVQRMPAIGGLASSRRGSVMSNIASSRKGSLVGSIAASRKGSIMGSIAASRKASTAASISASRRESLASVKGSLKSYRKESIAGSTSASRRSSRLVSSSVHNQVQRQAAGTSGQTSAVDGVLDVEELFSVPATSRLVDVNHITGLAKALDIAERALVQNTFHNKLLLYRDFKPRDQESSKGFHGNEFGMKPSEDPTTTLTGQNVDSFPEKLYWLWNFECPSIEGRNITCMVWNKARKDLLIVGYGQYEFGSQKDGLIAFWSLKNPRFPHACIPTTFGVTALDFSSNSPSLLAVGFYNGNVAVYDARNMKELEPVMQTSVSSGKHNDPVWKLEWIDSASDHGESIVSISTDGRVTQWSLKKDLEYVDLMKLKRVMSRTKGAQPQPFISRHAAGLCFDFSPRDPSIYLVGTEEGPIHKCSRSYREQYLQTYIGHTGPVFQVRWSQFLAYLFLSCSSDWTVRLWREEQESPLLVFQTANESVADVRWSHMHSCVFGTVSDDGRLEIWDLAVSATKPVIVHTVNNIKLTCILFSNDFPVVISSTSNGAISIFRMVGFDLGTDLDELQKLKKAITSNVNTILD